MNDHQKAQTLSVFFESTYPLIAEVRLIRSFKAP